MEDLKQAVIASQAEDAAMGVQPSRYYTAYKAGPTITVDAQPDQSSAIAALWRRSLRKPFREGIVYDTALSAVVYHESVRPTAAEGAKDRGEADAKTLLLDAIQRECEKLMTACGTPEQLACIGVMLHKLHLLRDFVSPPLEAKGGVGGSAKKHDKI